MMPNCLVAQQLPDGIWFDISNLTRKYMHAETPRLVDKTIVFSDKEVFKVVVNVTR
jgi:hypothetical protein